MNRTATISDSPAPAHAIGGGKDAVKSARQRAYDGLRAGILRGDFPPGEFIEEASATKATGVSRTPVREALSRLAAEGFLVLHPRRGAMVKPISTNELFDLYDVRLMVESHAIRRICRDKQPIPQLLFDLCDEHEEIADGDHLAFADLNHRFHETVVAAAGNAVLCQVFENLRANLTRVAMLSFQLGVPRVREGTSHRSIAEALAAYDEAKALSLTQEHLSSMPRVVASLSDFGQSK
ncbi:GntR family transcriptional regulator [Pelagibius sp. Alg239-R121]|uniref:GntR family transcriptional regulator n=1 Tax=Pelagibius sp. Alg239-R121 TaxID=2993448 RepID=UPI0024A636A3|nr:GntR family transcriptional regulator [Pelagibius sp. Alg239-R121]